MAKKRVSISKKHSKNRSAKSTPTLRNSKIEKLSKQYLDAYEKLTIGIASLLKEARHQVAKSTNAILTATYWETGRRIVEFEQDGESRAEYGVRLLINLSQDLKAKLGRGFGVDNLQRMRNFYLLYPLQKIYATVSRKSLSEPISAEYRLTLPDPKKLEEEIEKTRQSLQRLSKLSLEVEKDKTSKSHLNKRQNKFLSSVKKDYCITYNEYADKMGISAATAHRDLMDLLNKGYVKKLEQDRKVCYMIV